MGETPEFSSDTLREMTKLIAAMRKSGLVDDAKMRQMLGQVVALFVRNEVEDVARIVTPRVVDAVFHSAQFSRSRSSS